MRKKDQSGKCIAAVTKIIKPENILEDYEVNFQPTDAIQAKKQSLI